MPNEVKKADLSVVEARKRGKPGMVRLMISLTQEKYERITAHALKESPVFPRPANEHLSILIEKHFEDLIDDIAK